MTNGADFDAFLEAAEARFGRVHVLVNDAIAQPKGIDVPTPGGRHAHAIRQAVVPPSMLSVVPVM